MGKKFVSIHVLDSSIDELTAYFDAWQNKGKIIQASGQDRKRQIIGYMDNAQTT